MEIEGFGKDYVGRLDVLADGNLLISVSEPAPPGTPDVIKEVGGNLLMEIHIERKLFKMLAAESDANFEEVWSNDLDELMCEFRRLRKEAVDKALDEVEKRHPKPVVQEIPEECPVCKIPIATMLIPWQGPPDSWGQLAFHIMYAHTPEFVDITCPCGFYSGDAGFYKEVAHLQAQPDLAKHLNDALTNKNR